MTVRRLLTDRWLGGLAVLASGLLVAVGIAGAASALAGPSLAVLAPSLVAAGLLTAVVLWAGAASVGSGRTPYW